MLNLRYDPPEPLKSPIKRVEINLENKEVCITGTIPKYTRHTSKIKLNLTYKNIRFNDSVTSYTDYLIVGLDPGMNKINAAKLKGVQCINYTEIECLR